MFRSTFPKLLFLFGLSPLAIAIAGCGEAPLPGIGGQDGGGVLDLGFWDATTSDSDGSIVSGDGSTLGADGSSPLGDSGAGDDGAVGSGDGAVGANDGAVGSGDGAVGSSDGAVGSGDGAVDSSDGAVGSGDGAVGSSDGGVGSSDGAVGSNDGAVGSNDGAVGSGDGAVGANDGAVGSGDGAVGANDGGLADAGPDGGALGGSLDDFCNGSGAAVTVGAGDQCSGDLAEQTFRFGVCTCNQLDVQSNLLVDAFDSRVGRYALTTTSGVNILDDGHVGVNGALNMAGRLTALGSVFVSGGGFSVGNQSLVTVNVYSSNTAEQVNSVTTIGRNAFVNGDVIGRYDIARDLFVPNGASVDPATVNRLGGQIVRGPLSPVTPCPCGPSELLDVQSIVDFGQMFNDNATIGVISSDAWATGTGPDVIELPCGRYYLTSINHPRSLTIRALARTVLYVDGDVIVSGSLRLEVMPGAEIDLFIAGSLDPQASLRFGVAEEPVAVRTYVGGSGTIFIDANSLFGGNLYAPNAPIVFGASTDVFGALFASSISFGGNAAVHFDNSIRSAGDGCEPPPAGGTDGGVTGGGDAGVPDSGTCNQCWECGSGGACLPGGVCGGCGSDLDCCPTEVCEMGACIPTL